MGTQLPDNLEAQLLVLIRERFLETREAMTPATDLFAAGLDSMGIMQLMIAAEECFGVRIPEAEVNKQNFATAANLAALLRRCPASA
jgi:acyl carrier protein